MHSNEEPAAPLARLFFPAIPCHDLLRSSRVQLVEPKVLKHTARLRKIPERK